MDCRNSLLVRVFLEAPLDKSRQSFARGAKLCATKAIERQIAGLKAATKVGTASSAPTTKAKNPTLHKNRSGWGTRKNRRKKAAELREGREALRYKWRLSALRVSDALRDARAQPGRRGR